MTIKIFHVSNDRFENQCYLIYHNNTGILIDPAWNYTLIDNFLKDQQIILKDILLTHSHKDHTNLAKEFAEKYHVSVFMSSVEIDDYGFDCVNLKRANHLEEIVFENFKIVPIHTPGHTSGSMCYLTEENLFSGDTVFIEGVGKCDTKGSDVNQMYDSIQFLKQYLPQNTLFWPGHSYGELPGQSLEFLLTNNIYFQLNERKHFVAFRMRNVNRSV